MKQQSDSRNTQNHTKFEKKSIMKSYYIEDGSICSFVPCFTVH